MHQSLAEMVGPLLFPPDAWKGRARHMSLGDRPIYCIQRPGEVLWLPRMWWHATMNLRPSVSYGTKPSATSRDIEEKALATNARFVTSSMRNEYAGASAPLASLLARFKAEPTWDFDRGAEKLLYPGVDAPLWYDVAQTQMWARKGVSIQRPADGKEKHRMKVDEDGASWAAIMIDDYEGVLFHVVRAVKSTLDKQDTAAMRATAAFIICHMVMQMKRLAADFYTLLATKKGKSLEQQLPYESLVAPTLKKWQTLALNFSAAVHKRQCLAVPDREAWMGHTPYSSHAVEKPLTRKRKSP